MRNMKNCYKAKLFARKDLPIFCWSIFYSNYVYDNLKELFTQKFHTKLIKYNYVLGL